jgi:hypothetical protein
MLTGRSYHTQDLHMSVRANIVTVGYSVFMEPYILLVCHMYCLCVAYMFTVDI